MREWNVAIKPSELDCFFVEPGTAPKGAVIIAHEVWGLDDHIRDIARRVAREGYIAAAPDLYTRKPRPPGESIDVLYPFLFSFPDAQAIIDLQATLTLLKTDYGENLKVAAMGFCIGGTWCRMLSARDNRVAGVIDFYGRLKYPELSEAKPRQPWEFVAEMQSPYLGLFGEKDPVIPPEDIAKLRMGLSEAGVDSKVEVIKDAPHAFFNDSRALYDDKSAKVAWEEVRAFLSRVLTESGSR